MWRRALWIGAATALVVAALALVAARRADDEPSGPRQHVVRLNRTSPERVAIGADGSVWLADSYGGVVRLDSAGRSSERALAHTVADLVRGPDGAMWFAAYEAVGRIDRAGALKTWPEDALAVFRAITATSDAVWVANESAAAIERFTTGGRMKRFRLTGPRATLWITGMAPGPDGAVWFTQSGSGSEPGDAIGRMTSDGRYASWPVPRRRAAPLRIAAGPDGALWFTEENAHAIGRITTRGAITEFPLRTGLSPTDITAGRDGALWFAADGCVGRITVAGRVTAWPVRGAGRLVGIAAAPDGSFWLADAIGRAARRFTPPRDVASPHACSPPTVTRTAGRTRATLVYRKRDTFEGADWFTDARVRIARRGSEVFAEVVPPSKRGRPGYGVFGSTSSFAVRDLDGDGEPEVLLELNWNGTHCCSWSRVYRYVPARRTYLPLEHMWGNASSAARVRDLDGDGRPEFVSQDDRFAYDFDGYAGSVRPIRIFAYRDGDFRDVTRGYPAQIRRDADEIWRLYLKHRGKRSVQGILAAWVADQYMLGRRKTAERALAQASRRGYLDCRSALRCFGQPHTGAAYVKAVDRLLRRTGYVRG